MEDLELVCVRKEGTSNIAFELTDCVDFDHFCVTVLCFVNIFDH